PGVTWSPMRSGQSIRGSGRAGRSTARRGGPSRPGTSSRQPVADAIHRLDELRRAALVDLVAQVRDVAGDAIRGAFEVVVSGALRDLRLGQHLVGMAHQELEEGELPGG